MICAIHRRRRRCHRARTRRWLVGTLLPSFALAAIACANRGLDEPEAQSTDSGTADASARPETSDEPGNTSTSGDTSLDGDGSDDSAPPDLPTPDLPPSEPTDPCEAHLDIDQDPDQTCGLLHVDFEPDGAALSFGATCRLAAAAVCIAAQRGPLYLEAAAAADEGSDEEGAILLSEARGVVVEAFLIEQGVADAAIQVVVKGNLEAKQPAWDGDRRVRLRW